MDGLLLDTEPLWGKSMLRIAQKHQIPVTLQQFKETTGLKIYEVVQYWSIKYPWPDSNIDWVVNEIIDDIIRLSKQEARIMPGVINLLQNLKGKGYKLGVATSSPQKMLEELIDFFKLGQYFERLVSADSVGFGKPHPAVFLECATKLKSNPLQCVVFEDSINGVIAGKAARMKVIAVPDAAHFDDRRFAIADNKVSSLEDIVIENDFV